mmetsp:Transcript_20658/g.33546  ORF Transcript_20658/g.33546 Transcript_20658/m.33546 type:complete len:246 (-) Transcript_20658:116-853(-)
MPSSRRWWWQQSRGPWGRPQGWRTKYESPCQYYQSRKQFASRWDCPTAGEDGARRCFLRCRRWRSSHRRGATVPQPCPRRPAPGPGVPDYRHPSASICVVAKCSSPWSDVDDGACGCWTKLSFPKRTLRYRTIRCGTTSVSPDPWEEVPPPDRPESSCGTSSSTTRRLRSRTSAPALARPASWTADSPLPSSPPDWSTAASCPWIPRRRAAEATDWAWSRSNSRSRFDPSQRRPPLRRDPVEGCS